MYLKSIKKASKKKLIDLCALIEKKPYRYNDVIVTLYHDVNNLNNDYSIIDSVFEEQINFLLKQNVNWFLASELAKTINNIQDHNSICITFDDGTNSSYSSILNLLEKGIKSTQFIIPERIEQKQKNTMSWEQIIELNNLGVEIGSHSLSHPFLTKLSNKDLQKELQESKKIIEDKLGKEVTSFAYPYGDFNPKVVKIVKESGYQCAFTTQHLYASKKFDAYHIPRFEPIKSVNDIKELFIGQAHYFYRILQYYLSFKNK